MGLETATYVGDLVATNPTAGDPRSQGDDHIRLLKAVLQATFPQLSTYVNMEDLGAGGMKVNGPLFSAKGLFELAINLGSGSKVQLSLLSPPVRRYPLTLYSVFNWN
jgi:hypothetical protein